MKEYFSIGDLNRYRGFSVFSIRYAAGHTAHMAHGTPADTLIVMLKGSVRCSMPGQEDILLTPDKITWFARNCARTSVYLTETHLLSIHIDCEAAVFRHSYGQLPVSDMDAHAADCFQTLIAAANGDTRFSELTAASCLYGLLDYCVSSSPPEIPVKYRAIHDAKCAIDADFTSERPISDYARAAAMSESTFRRLFTEYTGQPPIRYRLTLRLEYVKLLVRSGECSLSEAAVRAGFNSLPYLCRKFRQIYGQSVSEFLRQTER
ncbi:MAG: helix-turn-helix transcriptional regulator [Clostridia bacterium]|nr:helix-turn-helix transcriptional regulator [Clostridia bacterium]